MINQKTMVTIINNLVAEGKKEHVFKARASGNKIEITKIVTNEFVGSFTPIEVEEWVEDIVRKGYRDARYVVERKPEERRGAPARKHAPAPDLVKEKANEERLRRIALARSGPRTVVLRGQGKPKKAL